MCSARQVAAWPCPYLQPASTGPLQATITIDTDAEFFGLFGGNVQNGLNYIALMTTCAFLAAWVSAARAFCRRHACTIHRLGPALVAPCAARSSLTRLPCTLPSADLDVVFSREIGVGIRLGEPCTCS